MRIRVFIITVIAFLMLLAKSTLPVAVAGDQPTSQEPSFRLDKRQLWTTSRIQGSPDPAKPYITRRAFPHLKFEEPLDMQSDPKSDRLYVVERYGKIYSFANDPNVNQTDLLLDLGKVIYGLALDPQFHTNGIFYITYVIDPTEELPRGTRLARFKTKENNPLQADPTSEELIMEWPSGGHNGGCLAFGPDGYLYVATGDGSGIADLYQTGQDLTDVRGKILRIDVQGKQPQMAYRIPDDNPFVGTEKARGEIWAYGLRQPWKLSFDSLTGELWTGNVGQDLWEMIFLIEKGGNYGWSVSEGSHPFRPERPRGPSSILQPIVEHNHSEFRSITGGYVYHGNRLNGLYGKYIYGDYDTGKIWSLHHDPNSDTVTDHEELVDSSIRLVGFAQDRSGELYMVDHMGGGIHELVANPAADVITDFPRKLSETGLFTSTRDLVPATGLIPYSTIAPSWSDGAEKQWYLAMPNDSKIEYEAMDFPQPAPGAVPGWKFPNGTVIVETIFLEMEKGNSDSRRRLETRILHHERLTGSEDVGDQYWRGYTYIWNDEQNDATLLEDTRGMDRTFEITDAESPGGKREQTWHFPSRAECTVCHNMAAKYVLGINTLQLNKEHSYAQDVVNQLTAWEKLGLFSSPLPASTEQLPLLSDYRNAAEEVDTRARSYLHANCSHCHRKWGGGNAEFQFLYSLPLPDTGTVGVRPGQGTFYLPHAEVIAAGDPNRSIALLRMSTVGSGRMPRLGSGMVDKQGIALLHTWIEQLSGSETQETVLDIAKRDQTAVDDLIKVLDPTPGLEAQTQTIEQLLASTRGAMSLLHALSSQSLSDSVKQTAITRATQHPEGHIRDLFEQFLPEGERTKRLGTAIVAEDILALSGNIARGRTVFFNTAGVQCRNCHRITNQGTEIGPDLDKIGKKHSREQLLETILEPSKVIEEKYVAHLIETTEGKVFSGLIVKRDTESIILKDAQNKLVEIANDDLEQVTPLQQSLMPDLLLRDMTAQQVADLISFLSTLK